MSLSGGLRRRGTPPGMDNDRQRDGAITSDNKIVNRGKTRQTFPDLRRCLHCQRFDNGYILQHILSQAVPFF